MIVISHMNIYFTIKVSLCLIAKDNIHLLNTFKNGDEYHCGAQQFADQTHLPLESLKAQSEESCGPSSTTQSTKQFLGSSRGQFSPRQIHNPTRIKG